jgi:AP-2 complex subunit alpha
LKQPNWHETLVKVGGYILGEFGHLIADAPGYGPLAQLQLLQPKFTGCSPATKALLLSTFVKFVNLYPEITEQAREVFRSFQDHLDPEIQQRAVEYLRMTSVSESLLQAVWDAMPHFPDRQRALIDDESVGASTPASPPKSAAPVTAPQVVSRPPAKSLIDDEPSPAPAPSPAAPKKDLMDDLASIFSAAPTTPAPVPVASPAVPVPVAGNPFGNPVATTTPPLQPVAPVVAGPDSDSFKRLLMAPEGVLYQDENIQIGFKSEFQKGMGRMMLYYGNVSNVPLTSFTTVFPPVGCILCRFLSFIVFFFLYYNFPPFLSFNSTWTLA